MNEEQQPDELDKEARVLSVEKAKRKLTELAKASPDFASFRAKLSDNLWWYLGDPMPENFRDWTWAQFEEFYHSVKG